MASRAGAHARRTPIGADAGAVAWPGPKLAVEPVAAESIGNPGDSGDAWPRGRVGRVGCRWRRGHGSTFGRLALRGLQACRGARLRNCPSRGPRPVPRAPPSPFLRAPESATHALIRATVWCSMVRHANRALACLFGGKLLIRPAARTVAWAVKPPVRADAARKSGGYRRYPPADSRSDARRDRRGLLLTGFAGQRTLPHPKCDRRTGVALPSPAA
jgi:hypothetical protein